MPHKENNDGMGFSPFGDGETQPLLSRREMREQMLREHAAREAEAQAVAHAAEEAAAARAAAAAAAETVAVEVAGAAPEPAPVADLAQPEPLQPFVSSAPIPPTVTKPKRKRRRVIISLVVILALLGALTGGGLVLWASYGDQISSSLGLTPTDYEGSGTGEVIITIVKGDDGTSIARTLEENGVVMTAQVFVDHLLEQKPAPIFQPGAYRLAKEMSSAAALAALEDPANKIDMTAVIPEGTRASRIYTIVSTVTGIPEEDFVAAAENWAALGVPATAPNIEGWLFPATYEFGVDDTAETILQKMVNRTFQALNEAAVPVEDEERIVTTASVIQREARQEQDFYKVSRVIANRIAQGMKLQMDSTSQYGLPDTKGQVWTSDEQRSDPNPWNTYFNVGLPIGPISNPGDIAIDAAMNPADGDWLYFVTVNLNTGETKFSSTLEEHEANTEELREWCAVNKADGC